MSENYSNQFSPPKAEIGVMRLLLAYLTKCIGEFECRCKVWEISCTSNVVIIHYLPVFVYLNYECRRLLFAERGGASFTRNTFHSRKPFHFFTPMKGCCHALRLSSQPSRVLPIFSSYHPSRISVTPCLLIQPVQDALTKKGKIQSLGNASPGRKT